MRRILIVLLVLIGLVLAAAILVPALISKDWVRTQTQAAASEALGRDVVLAGDIGLQILPSVQVRAQNASIANADGFGEAPFAEMAELRVSLALFPLITRQVQVEEFVLIEPVIRLESRNGTNNWTFETASSEAPVQTPPSDGFQRVPGALPFEASFGDVRIENGAVFFDDGVQTRRVEQLNLMASLPSVDRPIRLDGSFAADGRDMAFDLSLASLRDFFEGRQTEFSASLTGPLADLTANGQFLESPDLAFQGTLNMTLPLRAVSRYLGTDLPDGETFQRFATDARFEGAPGRIAINAERIQFDDIVASGNLALDYSRSRPSITGAINSERIDITPYIPAESDAAPASGTSSGIAPWSDEPMDVAALRALDLDLNIQADVLKALDVEVSAVRANLSVDRGRLQAQLSQFELYGGTGQAVAVLNARQATPSMSFDAELENLQALPFLTAAAQFDRLSGLGSFDLFVESTGASPALIMNRLSGNGEFSFADGAIRGVNLAQMIRTVQTALETRALPAAFSEGEQTDFSSLTGTFTIQGGVVNNPDLLMLSPLLRVNGQGQVDLGAQSVDYRLTPRAVSSLTGQGGETDLQGLAVPVRLRGDFNNVSAGIDFEAVAAALLRQQASRLLGVDTNVNDDTPPSTEDVVRGLFGQLLNQGSDSDSDDEDTDPPN